MRARGMRWAVFVACVVSSACGSDKSSSPKGGGASGIGGDDEPSGGSTGTAGSSGGSTGNTGGSIANDGGMPSAGQAGDDNAVAGAAGSTDDTPGPKTIHFIVAAAENVRAISPLIYGANMDGLDCSDSKARFSFCRHHSPAWSTYNWENNASNAGQSDCNENNAALSASTTPGAAVTDLIVKAKAAGASTIVTVPMLDHVALDVDDGSAAPECPG